MKLYEIVSEYRELQEAIHEGLIPDEAIDDMLEAVQVPFEEKVDSIATWVKELDAESNAIEAEIKNLTERKRAKTNLQNRLKEAILRAMSETGHDKVETPRNRVSTRTSTKVEVLDMDKLLALPNADDYVRYSEPTPNKTAISKALKEGVDVAGCVLTQSVSVQIK